MPISMYDATVPILVRGLTVLSDLLDKGERHADLATADLAGT